MLLGIDVAAGRDRHADLGGLRDPLMDLPCAQRRGVGLDRLADVRAFDKSNVPLNEPQYVIAAGLAGGFAYWAVAGWTAGFWKPVYRAADTAKHAAARQAIRSIRPRKQKPDGERAHQAGEQIVDRAHRLGRAPDRAGETLGSQNQRAQIGMPSAMK